MFEYPFNKLDQLTIDDILILDNDIQNFINQKFDAIIKESEISIHKENSFFEDAKLLLKAPKIIFLQHFIPQNGIKVEKAIMCKDQIICEARPYLFSASMLIYLDNQKIGEIQYTKWNELRACGKILIC